jgi:uncharacterized membrane protein
MLAFAKLLHLVAAILWVGGMGFVLLALRPVAHAQLQPPARLPLMCAVLSRFFFVVWLSIAALAATGAYMLGTSGMHAAPLGWHWMMGIGLLMMALFAHIYFAPFRRLKLAVLAADWPEGGRRIGQIALLVKINFALAWLAIAAVVLVQ